MNVVEIESPVGPLCIAERGGVVIGLGFADHWPRLLRSLLTRFDTSESEVTSLAPGKSAAATRISAYLDGDLRAVGPIPVYARGTPFQERVWRALNTIPVGQTASYAAMANAIGAPRAVRAVAQANGANPVSILIPCHRVIRSDGSLCGYGGGVERKRWLLAHEGVRMD